MTSSYLDISVINSSVSKLVLVGENHHRYLVVGVWGAQGCPARAPAGSNVVASVNFKISLIIRLSFELLHSESSSFMSSNFFWAALFLVLAMEKGAIGFSGMAPGHKFHVVNRISRGSLSKCEVRGSTAGRIRWSALPLSMVKRGNENRSFLIEYISLLPTFACGEHSAPIFLITLLVLELIVHFLSALCGTVRPSLSRTNAFPDPAEGSPWTPLLQNATDYM